MPAASESSRGSRRDIPRLALVVSRYNATITDRLEQGAIAAYEDLGGDARDILVAPAAGSWELIPLVQAACDRADIDGVVALGCIIKGETSHDRVLADAVTGMLAQISVASRKPVGLGVLTVENVAQAQARAGGDQGNKGAEALLAVVETCRAVRDIREPAARSAPRKPARALPRPDKAVARLGVHVKARKAGGTR